MAGADSSWIVIVTSVLQFLIALYPLITSGSRIAVPHALELLLHAYSIPSSSIADITMLDQSHHHQAPIGIFKPYIARQAQTLRLKEKVWSLSGDSFDIRTAEKRPIFKVKGEMFSLSGRKHFMETNGTRLFTIRKQLIAWHETFYAEDPSGNQIFEVRSKFSIGAPKSLCTFISATGQPVSLLMKGELSKKGGNIVDETTGQPVATIKRQLFNKGELFGQQTYDVSIVPNVDMAVIAAMCICLDEMQNDKQ
ncbi:Uu.00g050930.m01.CDS01 [Anthostomella pinea]|uniref:Uu.00g050930.m01.CDS01 n=1 Tax=Anthostomella pinea TaxID=933095 RepID=A0AAI8VM60_9PEZI|nr:Uu.00g050930.m01.CDS01 [Anthostomella pinea]